eukprot:10425869-Ditylum_brightwellii.AAC.1
MSVYQPESSHGTWYIKHNLQLFDWGRGRATYDIWSLPELLGCHIICNSLTGGEGELHMLSGAYLNCWQ